MTDTSSSTTSSPTGPWQRGLAWLRRALPWLVLAGFVFWSLRGSGPAAAFPVGAQLPALRAQLADGSRLALPEAHGQVVVLNFWASYCEPCRLEAPLLSGAQAQGVRVVGLSVEPLEPSEVARQADRIGMRYPVGVADEAMLSRFRVQSVPTTYVIGKNGKIVLSRVGALARRELEEAIAAARDAT